MKKIMATVLAAALCVSAFAKTYTELKTEAAEKLGTVKSGSEDFYKLRKNIALENSAVLSASLEEFGKDADSFLLWGEGDAKGLTNEEYQKKTVMRHLYATHFGLHPEEQATIPAFLACIVWPLHYQKYIETANPTFYAELKASGWKIGGREIPQWCKILLAQANGDDDFIYALGFENGRNNPVFLKIWKQKLSTMTPAEAYKATCDAEDFLDSLATQTAKDKELLQTVREQQDKYYLRLTRGNKIK